MAFFLGKTLGDTSYRLWRRIKCEGNRELAETPDGLRLAEKHATQVKSPFRTCATLRVPDREPSMDDTLPKKPTRHTKPSPSKTEVHVGDLVRHLRKTLHLSVRTLADKCGFSPSFISQIELRQASPSIASTERIASALGVTLGEFFRAVDPPLPAIIRSNARSVVQSEWSRAKIEALGPFAKDSRLEPMVITIQAGGASGSKPYVRQAEQLAVILKGTVELTLEEEVHDLKRGDAAGIPPGSRHCWRNKSQRPAQILIVTAHRAM